MGSTAEATTDIAASWEMDLAQVLGSDLLARIIFGLAIIFVAAWLAHVLVRAFNRVLRVGDSPVADISFFDTVIRALVYGAAACALLSACFGVDVSTFVAALGIGGIAISLGLQDTLKNLIGGLTIMATKTFVPGDNITIGGQTGVVTDIDWRHTTIKNRVGEVIMIPNSNMTTNAVTVTAPLEKSIVYFVVTNGRDLDEVAVEVARLAREAALSVSPVEREPEVLFSEVTEYGARGKVQLWIEDGSMINYVNDAVARAISPAVR